MQLENGYQNQGMHVPYNVSRPPHTVSLANHATLEVDGLRYIECGDVSCMPW